jgi:endonuclease YncB( thermonuclease family)
MLRFSSHAAQARGATAPAWTTLVLGVGIAVGIALVSLTVKRDEVFVPGGAASMIPAASHYQAAVLRIVDGDTFVARVHVRDGLDVATKVRLRSIDAPELHARCADEFVKARAATAGLRALLDQREVTLSAIGFDKYGRVLADVATVRTPDVGAAMLKQGLARPYAGGHRESWCPTHWW